MTQAVPVLKEVASVQALDSLFEQYAWELDVEWQQRRHTGKSMSLKMEKEARDWDANLVERFDTNPEKRKAQTLDKGKGVPPTLGSGPVTRGRSASSTIASVSGRPPKRQRLHRGR